MTGVGSIQSRNPEERRNIRLAFGTSLIVHSVGLVAWIMLATAMLTLNQALLRDLEEARRRAIAAQVPTIYVEVSPEQTTPEPPPDTPYYSTANSVAANPEPDQETDTPKIDGSQQELVRTRDVLRPEPEPPQPLPPPEPVPPTPELSEDPAIAPDRATPAAAERPPPRTLVEARMRQGMLVGPKLRQDGGARRRGAMSLDAKGSPFGAYDAAVIAAIQQRWYDLIDDSSIALRPGRVVITFTLHVDGRLTDIEIGDQEVGEIQALYCRKAITDPAPYARWPEEIRHLLGRDYRDLRITFHYF